MEEIIRNLEDENIIKKAEWSTNIKGSKIQEVDLENLLERIDMFLEKITVFQERINDYIDKNDISLEKMEEIEEFEDDRKLIENELLKFKERMIEFTKNIKYLQEKELDKDYDNDGLSNREEIIKGYNPLNYDTDGDGKSDLEEEREFYEK